MDVEIFNLSQNFIIGRDPQTIIRRIGNIVEEWTFLNTGTYRKEWTHTVLFSNPTRLLMDDAILHVDQDNQTVKLTWYTYEKIEVTVFRYSEFWMRNKSTVWNDRLNLLETL